MEESEKNNLVEQFIGVTGSAPEFAQSFLETAGWDLNEALNMYLGGGGSTAASMSTQRSTNTNNTLTQENNILRIMEEQGVDEATARAIAAAQTPETETVREPIAATRSRLMDDLGASHFRQARQQFSNFENGLGFNFQEQFGTFGTHQTQQADPDRLTSVQTQHNDVTMEEVENFEENLDTTTRRSNIDNNTTLQSLFSPPRDLLFHGTFEQARDLGKVENKWLLINIQKDSEFLSYNLNRDLWSNEIISDLVRQVFVFFQHEVSSAEAQRYITYYSPSSFPHIAILDPFTGEQRLVLDNLLVKVQNSYNEDDLRANFLEAVNTFLEENILEGEKIRRMQQIMKQRYQNKPVNISQAAQHDREHAASHAVHVAHSNLEDEANVSLEEEPKDGKDVTAVQFRLFGKRNVKRRFKKNQKINDLFTFVRQEVPEARDRPFDLVLFPQKSLAQFRDSSLQQLNVLNVTLSAVFM